MGYYIKQCNAESQVNNYYNSFNPQQFANISETMYKQLLRNNDRVLCCSRYKWENLPNGWTSKDIETMLYQYSSICCFMDNDMLTFAPYSLNGKLNKKGKLNRIQPLTLDGKAYQNKKRVYNNSCGLEFDNNCAILIHDYTMPLTVDKFVSRETINNLSTISDEVKIYKLMLMNLVTGIKKLLISCESEEQAKQIIKQAQTLLDPSQPIIAITKGSNFISNLDITNFNNNLQIDELTRAIDFYNKMRRVNNGVPAPDTFEKKERMITDELENSGIHTNLILDDGLENRMTACQLINKCFNININVTINPQIYNNVSRETLLGGDENEL